MSVILKEGREKSVKRGHPWIFSGAVETFPEFSSGDLLSVYSSSGEFLAKALFHRENSLAGRILSFRDQTIETILQEKIAQALALRKDSSCRLINAEGDGLSGLIVDRYEETLVLQIGSVGMERVKPLIVDTLIHLAAPKTIYEKSLSSSRLEEGLEPAEGLLWGEPIQEKILSENGLSFIVDIVQGQKSGFFLDQREMRKKCSEMARGKRVLNCFAYSGGFSLAALKGGASHVTSVDICPRATALNERNTLLNGFSFDRHTIVQQDVFAFLESSPLDFDLIILDPPAFAKKRKDLNNACFGYKKLHHLVFQKAKPGTLLFTSSCSTFITEPLFQDILSQAASETGREATILSRHLQAQDHPVSLHHPEGAYLKSFILSLH